MELIITENYEEMSNVAANYILALIQEKPTATLALTTGNTPLGLYKKLIELYDAKQISLTDTTIFSTEEYLGVPPEASFSLFNWLNRSLLIPCNIDPFQVIRLKGEDPDPEHACATFDQLIERRGGIDLILEGLGTNGHIGFNEPGTSNISKTRIVALSKETSDYNFQYWNQKVPEQAMTIGMSQILEAKKILILASGVKKAEALYKALKGPVTSDVPASFLQRAEQLIVIADKEASQLLKEEGASCQST